MVARAILAGITVGIVVLVLCVRWTRRHPLAREDTWTAFLRGILLGCLPLLAGQSTVQWILGTIKPVALSAGFLTAVVLLITFGYCGMRWHPFADRPHLRKWLATVGYCTSILLSYAGALAVYDAISGEARLSSSTLFFVSVWCSIFIVEGARAIDNSRAEKAQTGIAQPQRGVSASTDTIRTDPGNT